MIGKLVRTAKSMLAQPAVRRSVNAVNRGVLEFAGSTRVGATLYSIPGFFTHNREQYAVLSGRRAYYRNLGTFRSSHVELRRNIHRLEKGILMRPRRAVFARDFIGETLDFYQHALARPGSVGDLDAGEMQWAHDVLTEYFRLVDDDGGPIEQARERFAGLPAPGESGAIHPFPQGTLTRTDISYDQMLGLATSRRSVRWFAARPVERELIDQALAVARQSPSACNRLPWTMLVFDDPEQVQRVASIPFGAAGYSHQIPTVIVVKADLSSYFSPRDRHVPYIDASLAAMGFIYALETLGLSSSIINWPDFEPLEAKMSSLLQLKPYERVVMLIAVGYPDPEALVAYSKKKDLATLRRFNALDPSHDA